MQVKELMTSDVRTCRPEEPLQRAAQLMWEGDVGCIPVVDNHQQVVGVITDRDICMAAYTQGSDLASRSVACGMSKQVHACGPDDSIAVAEERMRVQQIRRMPVVNGGRLVGMLSLNDLACAAGNKKGSRTGIVTPEEVATTLCRIGEHRRERAMAAE